MGLYFFFDLHGDLKGKVHFSHENQTPVPDCVCAQDPYVMISGGGGAVGGVRAVRAEDALEPFHGIRTYVGCLGPTWGQLGTDTAILLLLEFPNTVCLLQ